jgi:hypothetical protein
MKLRINKKILRNSIIKRFSSSKNYKCSNFSHKKQLIRNSNYSIQDSKKMMKQ